MPRSMYAMPRSMYAMPRSMYAYMLRRARLWAARRSYPLHIGVRGYMLQMLHRWPVPRAVAFAAAYHVARQGW